MATPAVTEVSICSNALTKLGESTITSLTDNSTAARTCNLLYGPTRDSVLRAHPWNFALKRAALAADATAPVWGYDYAYQLPSDCLRVIQTDADDTDPFKVEGRQILTDATAPLNILYVRRVEETPDFDSLFVDALTARMVFEMANPITAKRRYAEEAMAEYLSKLRDARTADGMEGTMEQLDANTLADFRQ